MSDFFSNFLNNFILCGSLKAKKRSTGPAPIVVWSNPKETPVLTNPKSNPLYRARLEAKQKLEDEKFIDSLGKDPVQIQEFDNCDRSFFGRQLRRSFCRRDTASCLSISPTLK